MARRTQLALKVVNRPSYYEGELFFQEGLSQEEVSQEKGGSTHSLHKLCPVPYEVNPSYIAAVLQSFSRPGDRVLDPICRSGAVGLEAVLSERQAVLADTDSVALAISRSKVWAADLTEVALWLQMTPLKAPASFDGYEEYFSPFFDIDTFREISHLRRALRKGGEGDRLLSFISVLSLGVLHGRGAGNLSVYSPSERGLTPKLQRELNYRRHQTPDHRAIPPRLLRKTAFALQDGIPSVLRSSYAPAADIHSSDPRNLSHLNTGSVDITVTNVKVPRYKAHWNSSWLRNWFLNGTLDSDHSSSKGCGAFSEATWGQYTNEMLLEAARVTRSGGKVVLFCDKFFSSDDLKHQHQGINSSEESVTVKDRLLELVHRDLGLYFDAECFLSVPEKRSTITGKSRLPSSLRYKAAVDGVLVLRRK